MLYIIANARYKGGLSGSDNIYLHLCKHSPMEVKCFEMMDIDFKPFTICYIWRIIKGCFGALITRRPQIVYSASDFWMDVFPALIYKLKGAKWIAGCYMFAPKNNTPYRISQFVVTPIIKLLADVVMITNDSMKYRFKNKKTVCAHGGYESEFAYPDPEEFKIYDAVFCGRIHPTKGIDELIEIWRRVVKYKPYARLAIIGDGDLGIDYILKKGIDGLNIDLLGYLGNERFDIYRKSKIFLYTTPKEHSHFCMAPIEAMACGCPMISFNLDVYKYVKWDGGAVADTLEGFVAAILDYLNGRYEVMSPPAIKYAKSWEWEKQAKRIWKELTEAL